MEFEVLGPLRVRVDEVEAAPLAPMSRIVLAVLLCQANRPVSVDVLVDALWEGRRTDNAKQKLQLHVHQVRRALGDASRIVHADGTYALTVYPGELDAERFESLLAEGREASAAADPRRCTALLRKALGMWRGAAYSSVGESVAVRQETERLSGLRLTAVEELYAAELAAGRHAEVVAELTDAVAREPLHEGLRVLLMAAFYRAGRQAEALRVYREGRDVLVDELGLEPGPELRRVEAAILAGEPVELGAERPEQAPEPLAIRPAQLPADSASFVGRAEEVEALVTLGSRPASASAATVVAVDGMAGAGKTALVVHVGHRLAPEYADGQLFLDLRGYAEGADPVDPAVALDRLLRSLGVPGERIPTDAADRAATWRSLLADRRMLVLLDNAESEAQVRPLLPAAAGCFVLVTSRRRLSGLDDATLVVLDVLASDEASALFRGSVGPDRLGDQPAEPVDEVVDLCGRLPLAVRIAAARLRDRVTWRLDDLARRLRDQRDLLDELEVGDRSVAAAFGMSYRQLDDAGRELFRRLGLHPGPDFDVRAAAALADWPVRTTRRRLEDLVDVHLLEQREPDRFHFQDLLGGYAARLAGREESSDAERRAVERLLDHYCGIVAAAAAAVELDDDGALPDDTPTTQVRFADSAAATTWLQAEHRNLMAAAAQATRVGSWEHIGWLSDRLYRPLLTAARHSDSLTLHGCALETARQRGDRSAEGKALRRLARVNYRLGDHSAAAEHSERAVAAYREADNPLGLYEALCLLAEVRDALGDITESRQLLEQARSLPLEPGSVTGRSLARMFHLLSGYSEMLGRQDEAVAYLREALSVPKNSIRGLTLIHLGIALRQAGQYDEAADHLTEAVDWFRQAGDRQGESHAVTQLAGSLRQRGQTDEALAHHEQALDIARELGDLNAEFEAQLQFGLTFDQRGEDRAAVRHLQRALDLARRADQPYDIGKTLDALAAVHHASGQADLAREEWREALAIYTRLGMPDADRIRDRLDELESTDPPAAD